MEQLSLASSEKALNSLKAIYERYKKEGDNDLKDAVIQRFEYTYSLCLKSINRFLNMQSIEPIVTMTFNELIRKANQMDLLYSNLEKWDDFRKKRNMTSHTYDEAIADEVLLIIPEFINEAQFLFEELKKRI